MKKNYIAPHIVSVKFQKHGIMAASTIININSSAEAVSADQAASRESADNAPSYNVWDD